MKQWTVVLYKKFEGVKIVHLKGELFQDLIGPYLLDGYHVQATFDGKLKNLFWQGLK